jgi:hypothetical protein
MRTNRGIGHLLLGFHFQDNTLAVMMHIRVAKIFGMLDVGSSMFVVRCLIFDFGPPRPALGAVKGALIR